jgi:hypothetical protein
MLYYSSMIAITAKVLKDGQGTLGVVLVPANHTEALGASKWGLIICGGLLLLMTSFICLLFHAVR